jgi:ATP-binding cassette subfamily A (ABC1) protein 3
MLVLYMSAYMTIVARSPPDQVMNQILLVHFTLGIITPIGQLTRAMIIGLNLFSVLCVGAPPVKSTHPADIKFYGGPIVYLIGQSLFLFALFIWYDHKFAIKGFQRSHPQPDLEDTGTNEPEVSSEIARTSSSASSDGLRVLHVSKQFKSLTTGTVNALDNCTFGVKRGEVFGLVGPNGAGKSTTISMLRGEIKPDAGSLYILSHPLLTTLEEARSHLGVCPQHDALDQMTVLSHLRFYAGIRGVRNIEDSVQNLVRAVGLAPFADRMANKLSGGNKRKLSLAIALVGNPEVLLLDEPSSGMDPLAKRSMWKTLSRFVPNRSILLTTHSMEEADALADRVGVLAKKVLDIGTTSHLRNKYGFGFHVHLVLKSAPNSTAEEMARVKAWIEERFPGAETEREAWLGQLRFNIPSTSTAPFNLPPNPEIETETDFATPDLSLIPSKADGEGPSVGSLFVLLEENKQNLGLEFYSVSVSTFDEVFLKVVRKHGVGEEDHADVGRWRKLLGQLKGLVLLLPFF